MFAGREFALGAAARLFGLAASLIPFLGLPLPAQAQEEGPTTIYELIEVVPDAPWDIQWKSVQDGAITQAGKDYTAEFTWDPPPESFDETGFEITVNVTATGGPTARIAAGTNAGGKHFDIDPDPGLAYVVAETNESKTASQTVKVVPRAGWSDGSVVEFWVGAQYGPYVYYRYKVSQQGGMQGPDGPQGPQGPQGPPRILNAEIECPQDVIVISELPSLNCALVITGWRRNTADPVQVSLPGMIDEFGNHANGIQIIDGDGTEDVFNWDEPHRWGFFVFACPSQQGTGANCYGSTTVPGPVAVEFIVRQGDMVSVPILGLTAIGRAGPGGAGGTTRIGNYWRFGDYLNLETGTLASGPVGPEWLSAQWTLEPVEGTVFVRIRNGWYQDYYVHAENGTLTAGPIQLEWRGAMWLIEPVEGADAFRFRNVRWADQYLHTEYGAVQVGAIDPQWESAMWTIE